MIKKIILIFVIICVVAGAISYGVLHYHYSDGVRSGKLVKISKKGMLLKTYEGILDLGSGDRLTWDFSVHDSKVGEKLLGLTGKKLKLRYTELLYKVFYNTKYNVTSWEVLSSTDKGGEDFCNLIHLMRKDQEIVTRLRTLMMKFGPELLIKARECQKP